MTAASKQARIARNMSHNSPLVCALVLAAAACAVTAGKYDGRLVIEDFEAFAWGEDWATVQFSPGADPRMKVERATVHSGRQACRLDVPPGESLTLVPQHGTGFVVGGGKPPLPLPGSPERVGLWVHGERSGHRLWLRVLDAAGKTTELSLGGVDFDGWRLLEARTLGLPPPLALAAVVVKGGEGRLVLDDLTVATSAAEPLHLAARLLAPEGDLVEGSPVQCLVSLQSLSQEPVEGCGELVAFEAASPAVAASRARFRFRASATEPFATTVGMRLPAGVYSLAAQAGGAKTTCQAVVHPAEPRAPERPRSAIRSFSERGDALRVYESALSPALVVETTGDRLTLFRGMAGLGLRPPQHLLTRMHPERTELLEPWVLLWFGDAPEWRGVKLADGSPCPTFDVPFLVVLDQSPIGWQTKAGLDLQFARRGARAAILPLLGVRGADPAETTGWHRSPETMAQLAKVCRFWTPLLRAVPVGVEEEWRVDAERDLVEVRVRFEYLESRTRWGGGGRRAAPVPPLLMLARQAGLSVRFSKEPVATGCATAVGPYYVVPNAEGYTYSLSGILRFVLNAVADLPANIPGPPISLARNYRTLSDDAAKIPFWTAHGKEAGKHAADALARFMLAPANARYVYDKGSSRLRAWDGLAAQVDGDRAAISLAAHTLQGCWYAGLHAGAWEPLHRRWRHIQAIHQTVASDDWATLGAGGGAGVLPGSQRSEAWVDADARLDAALYYARLSARLGRPEDFVRGCTQAVKLFAAAYALVAAAPKYVDDLQPWPGLTERRGRTIGACLRGRIGFAPGPPPFLATPTDGGYCFAAEFLGEYYREGFRSGPLDYFGRSPAEWSQRLFVAIDAPAASDRFCPAPPSSGTFATNYTYTVEDGPDGWPALVWRSHRAPAGGPLAFGSIGTLPQAEGKLARSHTVSPWLRLTAYRASEALPPPKEPECPTPPQPERPSAEKDRGRQGQGRP